MKRTSARKALDQHHSEIATTQARISELSTKRDRLQDGTNLSEIEGLRKQAAADFALDQISADEYETAKRTLDQALAKRQDTCAMVDAINTEIRRLTQKVDGLNANTPRFERALKQEYFDGLAAKVDVTAVKDALNAGGLIGLSREDAILKILGPSRVDERHAFRLAALDSLGLG